MSNDERAIRDLIDSWLRASEAGDTATLSDLLADDVVFLMPGRPPFGKEEFAAAQRGQEKLHLKAKCEFRELRVLGDWAFGWTDLTVAMTPADGGAAVRRTGHTLSIFHKLRDGHWVLARDANMLTVENSKPGG